MKYIVGLLLAAVIAWAAARTVRRARRGSACCGERDQTVKRRGAQDRNAAHYPYSLELEIGGMTCDNCARRVENALNALEGVWARVSISDHKAQVLLKTPPEEDALRRAVTQAGYAVLQIREVK